MQAPFLRDVGISVVGAVALAVPAYMTGMPIVLAYLGAGVAIGPNLGFGLIQSTESIGTLSEIGLILLMFILGLEIDLNKLLKAGKAVLLNGVTQFLGCLLLGILFFKAAGAGAGGTHELTYLGVACALSSTLVVVKILSDRMQLDTLTSRITLGILVIQDLWAITFLAIQPNLDRLEGSLLLLSLGKAAVLVIVGYVTAKFVLPRLFRAVAKQPELLLIVAMAWCFAMAGIANELKLSREMGALVAGVSIASFPYHAEIATKIGSVRDFFVMLFFVALGLQIPVPTAEVLVLSGKIIVFVMLSRVLTVFPVLYSLGYGNRGSLIPALNLSQVSEFALVLTALGVTYGHIPVTVVSAFVIALVVTVLISSFLIPGAHEVARALNPWLERIGIRDRIVEDNDSDGDKEQVASIVLLGFFREGSSLLQQLLSRRSMDAIQREVLVVDFNPEAHKRLKELKVPCKYADISHSDTLKHLGIERAKILVCTIPDHILKGTSNLDLLRQLKAIAPGAKVVVTAETIESAHEMYKEGADYVFLPRVVGAHYLADLLESFEAGKSSLIHDGAKRFLSTWKEVLP